MKKIGVFILIIFAISLVGADLCGIADKSTLEYVVSQDSDLSDPTELVVMEVSGPTNAHGSVYNGEPLQNWKYYLACNFEGRTFKTGTEIFSLKDSLNSHAEIPPLPNYLNQIKFADLYDCVVKTDGCNSISQVNVLSLSSNTNAHIGSSIDSDYNLNICCRRNVEITRECDNGVIESVGEECDSSAGSKNCVEPDPNNPKECTCMIGYDLDLNSENHDCVKNYNAYWSKEIEFGAGGPITELSQITELDLSAMDSQDNPINSVSLILENFDGNPEDIYFQIYDGSGDSLDNTNLILFDSIVTWKDIKEYLEENQIQNLNGFYFIASFTDSEGDKQIYSNDLSIIALYNPNNPMTCSDYNNLDTTNTQKEYACENDKLLSDSVNYEFELVHHTDEGCTYSYIKQCVWEDNQCVEKESWPYNEDESINAENACEVITPCVYESFTKDDCDKEGTDVRIFTYILKSGDPDSCDVPSNRPIPCPQKSLIPFFTTFNFVLTMSLISLIYISLILKKKE